MVPSPRPRTALLVSMRSSMITVSNQQQLVGPTAKKKPIQQASRTKFRAKQLLQIETAVPKANPGDGDFQAAIGCNYRDEDNPVTKYSRYRVF